MPWGWSLKELSGAVSQFSLSAGSEEYHAVCVYLYSGSAAFLPGNRGAAHRRREKGEAFEKLLSDSHGGPGGIHSTFMEVFISQPGVFECFLQYGAPAVTGLDEQQRSVLGAGCQLSVEEYGV